MGLSLLQHQPTLAKTLFSWKYHSLNWWFSTFYLMNRWLQACCIDWSGNVLWWGKRWVFWTTPTTKLQHKKNQHGSGLFLIISSFGMVSCYAPAWKETQHWHLFSFAIVCFSRWGEGSELFSSPWPHLCQVAPWLISRICFQYQAQISGDWLMFSEWELND